MRRIVLFGLFAILFNQQSHALELAGENVGPKVSRLLYDAQQKLPLSVRNAIQGKLYVEFETLPNDAFGKADRKFKFQSLKSISKIILSEKFIPALKGQKTKAPWTQDKALETLLHELGHIYDYRFAPTPHRKAELDQCKRSKLDRIRRDGQSHRNRKTVLKDRSATLSSRCFLLLEQSTNVSEDPRFLYLTGWYDVQKLKNTRPNRIPEYAFDNAREYFAVFFERFLRDPTFQCRMPALNKYFETKFDFIPFKNSDCYLDTEVAIKNTTSYADIDPDRIYEIHFLQASPGEAIESRFGHSLLRLVMCSPKRDTVGPECLKDVQYHVVMAYNGNVRDLKQSVIKGITGFYESQLLFLRWTLVEKEYNKENFRSFESIPLKINHDEMRQIVYRALELHWTYGGDYKFFSNNCATELYDVLRATINNEVLWETDIITPNGAFDVLKQAGLLDMSRRVVFDSYKPKLQKAYEEIAKANMQTGIASKLQLNGLDDYLNNSYADERIDFFNQAIASKKLKDPRKFVGSFYLLASYILNDLDKKLDQLTAGALLAGQEGRLSIRQGSDFDPEEEKKLNEQLMKFVYDVDNLLKLRESIIPSNRKISGYGIPQDDDYPESKDAQEEKVAEISSKIKGIYKDRKVFFDKYFQATSAEVKGTKSNMLIYLKKIREIGI